MKIEKFLFVLTTIVFIVACKIPPGKEVARNTNLSNTSKPTASPVAKAKMRLEKPGYEKFFPEQAGNFILKNASSEDNFYKSINASETGFGGYVYSDGRYDKWHTKSDAGEDIDYDVKFNVFKFAAPAEAQSYIKNYIHMKDAVPVETLAKRQIPKCKYDQPMGGYEGPNEITTQIPLRDGSMAYIVSQGKYYVSDCSQMKGGDYAWAFWTNGAYAFLGEAAPFKDSNFKPGETAARLEGFLPAYLTAAGLK